MVSRERPGIRMGSHCTVASGDAEKTGDGELFKKALY